MPSRRVQKAAQAIREVVSMAILTDLNDPRVRDVTVTFVEVSPDMRQAKIHVSIMGDDARQRLTLHGLKSAAGYLQSKVANRIQTRYTPRLEFVLDMGVKKSIEIAQILQRVLPAKPQDNPELDESTVDEDPNALDPEEADLDDADLDDADLDNADDQDPESIRSDGDPSSEAQNGDANPGGESLDNSVNLDDGAVARDGK